MTCEIDETERYFIALQEYFGGLRQLAELLNVTKHTVYKWRARKKIPRRHAIKIEEMTLGLIVPPLGMISVFLGRKEQYKNRRVVDGE